METISSFLKFAIDLGKLSANFKLYGERQVREGTSSPGDTLFDVIKNHKHFDDKNLFECEETCSVL